MNKLWRIWAKALGDKSGKNDKEADYLHELNCRVDNLLWFQKN